MRPSHGVFIGSGVNRRLDDHRARITPLSFQDQTQDQSPPGRYPNRWKKGQTGNPYGRRLAKEAEAARHAKVDMLIAALAKEYQASQSQNELLVIAAGMIVDASMSRDVIKRARLANTANRLLRDIPRRAPIEPARLTIAEHQQRGSK
jgi:hypothetical protein